MKNIWQLSERQIFELIKTEGNEFNIVTKVGRIKKVKTIVKKNRMSGNYYITYSGSEYLSLQDEIQKNVIPRAKKFGF